MIELAQDALLLLLLLLWFGIRFFAVAGVLTAIVVLLGWLTM